MYTDNDQYSQYSNEIIPVGDVTSTAPAAQVTPPSNKEEAGVTPQPPVQHQEPRFVQRDEKVEYRDQDGNLLDEEQVQALQQDGKVSFSTKYETKTRLVDADGNEVVDPQLAPHHPDVEGQNPDTKGVKEDEKSQPADAKVSGGSVNREDDGRAMPASDANEATK